MMLTFLGFNFMFNSLPAVWMDVGFMFVYYGLYFGVLGRDVSEICADKMAANIGVRTCQNVNEFHVFTIFFNRFILFAVLHAARNANAQFGAECVRCLWK